jgi:integrase
MGRHVKHEITITHLPRRAKPFQVQWRERDPVTGKRKRISKFFATEAQAHAFKDDVEALAKRQGGDERGGQVADDGPMTVRRFAAAWMADHVGLRRAAGTGTTYQSHFDRTILPAIGDCLLDDTFGYAHVVKVANVAARRKLAWTTQQTCLAALRAMLTAAVRLRHLKYNPLAMQVKELKPSHAVDPEPNPLTPAQADAFLAWVRTTAPAYYEYFLWLFRTGSRIGEAAALQWTHLQLDARRARLSKGFSQPLKAKDPKSDGDGKLKQKRPHDIDLSPELVTALRALRTRRNTDQLKRGRRRPYVFLTPQYTRVLPNSPARLLFAKGMQAIGAEAEAHTLHDIRDTFATSHFQRDPKRLPWVSWMLGHADTWVTSKRYIKWLPNAHEGAVYAADLDSPGAKVLATGSEE